MGAKRIFLSIFALRSFFRGRIGFDSDSSYPVQACRAM